MSSAYPDMNLHQLIDAASDAGLQGLELCVFRRDGDRSDHVATHLEYEDFGPAEAQRIIDLFNGRNMRFSIGSYDNLIGGDPAQREKNQNHLLKLIRIAALLGGNANGVKVGTFVGYNHEWDSQEGSYQRNLEEYRRVFTPIIRYAEDLGVTVLYENCPMEGWRSAGYANTMNNLPCTLASRKLMYAMIPSDAHGEIYDPSHDVWQYADPLSVLELSDIKRIHAVHLKTTRMKSAAETSLWGGVYGKQQISEELAAAAGISGAVHEWDRYSYEPMVPGFGGSDSMDWRAFTCRLSELGFSGPMSIENEGANSKGTGNAGATQQGFKACLQFMMPMIWPLTDSGYSFPGQPELHPAGSSDIRAVSMKDLI